MHGYGGTLDSGAVYIYVQAVLQHAGLLDEICGVNFAVVFLGVSF